MTETIGEWVAKNGLEDRYRVFVADASGTLEEATRFTPPPHVEAHIHNEIDRLNGLRLELEAELYVTNLRIDAMKKAL